MEHNYEDDEYSLMLETDLMDLASDLGVDTPKKWTPPDPADQRCSDCGLGLADGKKFSTDSRNKLCIGRNSCNLKDKAMREQRREDAVPAGYTLRDVCVEYVEDANVHCRNFIGTDKLAVRGKALTVRYNLQNRAAFYAGEILELERLEFFREQTGMEPFLIPSVGRYLGDPKAPYKKMQQFKSNKKDNRHEGKPDQTEPGWVHRLAWLRWKLHDVPQCFIDKVTEEAKTRHQIVTAKVRYADVKANEYVNFIANVSERVRHQTLLALAGDPTTLAEYVDYMSHPTEMLGIAPGDGEDVQLDVIRSCASAVHDAEVNYHYAGRDSLTPRADRRSAMIKLEAAQAEEMAEHQRLVDDVRGMFYGKGKKLIADGLMGTRREMMPKKFSNEALSKIVLTSNAEAQEHVAARPNGTLWYRVPADVLSDLDSYLDTGVIPNDTKVSRHYEGQHSFVGG